MRRELWLGFLMTCLFCGLMVLGSAAAQEPAPAGNTCSTSGLPTSRPGDPTRPTVIGLGVRLVDLVDIDDVEQTLTGEFFIRQRWTDPRLAALAGCEIPLANVWSPTIGFVNSGRIFPEFPQTVEIGADGTVTYLQNYFGRLASYESLEKFPFDDHVFEIWFTSDFYPDGAVAVRIDEQFTGRRELLNISDWRIGDVTARVERATMQATQHQVPAERVQLFYIWKIFFPLCLIVTMSWAVFWLNPANFGPQIGLSATSMLTLIAFLFATTNMVPPLAYLTTLDLFMIFALALVFLALVESLTTSYLVAHDRLDSARRLDRISRVLFPAAFLLIIVGFLIL